VNLLNEIQIDIEKTNGLKSCIATLLADNSGGLNNPKYFGDSENPVLFNFGLAPLEGGFRLRSI
jgi:hypothetical protein